MRLAVAARNEHKIYSMMSDAIVAFEDNLRPRLSGLLRDVQAAAGKATAKRLKEQLKARHASIRDMGFRASAPQIAGWDFNTSDPDAIAWVKAHAAETLTDLSETTRDAIKDLIETAFDGEYDVDALTDQITDLIGDAERAELIARTETMTAANEGQQEAWDQATEAGLLTGNETQVWIVTPDDRLCPICEPMEDQEAPMNGQFDVDGDLVDGPPAHPRCRCTLGLAL